MRGFRWSSPLRIALLGVIGSISGAIIVGIFSIWVAGREPPSVVLAGTEPKPAAAAKFLGDGYATAEGPASISLGSSASVVLTISLGKPLRAEDVIWVAAPPGQPAARAGPAGTTSYLLDAELSDVLIFSEMSARLDAPAFQYLETGWIAKEVRSSASWVWNIIPKDGKGTQAATISIKGPKGSGYEGIIQLEIIVL